VHLLKGMITQFHSGPQTRPIVQSRTKTSPTL